MHHVTWPNCMQDNVILSVSLDCRHGLWTKAFYLARLHMRVQEGSAVHISDAPIQMVGGLPVFFCLVDEAAQSLPLLPLGLAAGGQVRLCTAIAEHLVLHQHCIHRSLNPYVNAGVTASLHVSVGGSRHAALVAHCPWHVVTLAQRAVLCTRSV